eukprot:14531989-Ditylum_brightwellii.AAC.1
MHTGSIVISTSPNLRQHSNTDETAWDSGYGSDGNIGPLYDALDEEGGQMFDEDSIREEDTDTSMMKATTDIPP